MDFDPGFHEEMYDEDIDKDNEPEVEYDEFGNVIAVATAAGFGYYMAKDELEERKLAEDILKQREGKQEDPVKVPLAHRHTTKGEITPFGRWATRANQDPSKAKEEIQYTKEEQLQIIKAQAD